MKIVTTPQFDKSFRKLFNHPISLKEKILWNLEKPFKLFKDIKRELYFAWQRARHGVDNSMTWSLDYYIVDHFEKLLHQYLKQSEGFIVIEEDFRAYINQSLEALKAWKDIDDGEGSISNEEFDRRREALGLVFSSPYFRKLWN